MAKKPIMTSNVGMPVKVGSGELTQWELKQLEQLRKGIKISPCRGSEDPSTKSYIIDVTCAEFMTKEERLVSCQIKNSDIDLKLIQRHYNFILKNFPNFYKEEIQESVENGVEIFRKRIVRV